MSSESKQCQIPVLTSSGQAGFSEQALTVRQARAHEDVISCWVQVNVAKRSSLKVHPRTVAEDLGILKVGGAIVTDI